LFFSPYNLTAALYSETDSDKHSSVVVLVKAGSSIDRFEKLRTAKACFPEFGGIASIAFINTGKNRGIFQKSECDFTKLLANFFGDSCAPGSRDELHDPSGTTPQSLCNLCKESVVPLDVSPVSDDVYTDDDGGVEGDEDTRPASEDLDVPSIQADVTRNVNCAASYTNQFYGTRGALSCLNQ
jgi:Transferrin